MVSKSIVSAASSFIIPPKSPRFEWSPTGKPARIMADKPVGPLCFAGSLRERRDLVVRHPARPYIHPRPKPWPSASGVEQLRLSFGPEYRKGHEVFFLFQGFRPGLFYDVSTGESCPLRLPFDNPHGHELFGLKWPQGRATEGRIAQGCGFPH